MNQELGNTVALLRRTPAALDSLLRGLPDAWTFPNEGGESWNVREIVGHLAHAERTDWMPRVKHLRQFGEDRPFDPFDRLGQRRVMEGKTLEMLLDEFAGLRAASLEELRALHLDPAEMERRGLHPALGQLTLTNLLATWAVHDLTHIHQVARVLAYQYRGAVGPFQRYLGVLQCDGHSE